MEMRVAGFRLPPYGPADQLQGSPACPMRQVRLPRWASEGRLPRPGDGATMER